MKRLKRFIVPLLVAALALTLYTPVFAAGDGTQADPFVGTGDLNDSYAGIITIHKYDIAAWEKKMNEDPQSGKDPDYTIKYFGLDATGAEILAGGQVGYYYLNAADQAADQNRKPVMLSDLAAVSNIVFRLTSATPQSGKEGSINPDDYTIDTTAVDSYGKTENGEFKWTGVPQGYYILEEIANDAAIDLPQKFVVSMPMFHPSNTQATDPVNELKDIHIYPKNQIKPDPEVKKEYTANFENGNVISWKITAEIPGDILTSKKYTISDTFSKGLTLLPASIVVTKSATKGSPGSPLAATEYTVVGPITNNPEGTTTFSIDFNDTQRPALDGSVELVITYDTVVSLTAAEWDDAKQVSNDVLLEFTNEDGYEFKPSVPPVTVSALAELEIHKIDGATDEDLAGATFQIYTQASSGAVVAGSVFLDKNGNAANLVTDANGIATFYGLPAGKYYLVETAAPNKYKILDGYFEFEILDAMATANGKFEIGPVKNFLDSGFTLPQTGGPGTLWFTIIGVGLVLVGGLAYFVYKRRKNNTA